MAYRLYTVGLQALHRWLFQLVFFVIVGRIFQLFFLHVNWFFGTFDSDNVALALLSLFWGLGQLIAFFELFFLNIGFFNIVYEKVREREKETYPEHIPPGRAGLLKNGQKWRERGAALAREVT